MKKFFLFLFAAVLILSGCSSKPELKPEEEKSYNEISDLLTSVKNDIATAEKMGADQFAAEPFAQVKADEKTAENTLDLKDFGRAKEAAEKANAMIKSIINLPTDCEAAIAEADKEIEAAKAAKGDEESPANYKNAVDMVAAAKNAHDNANFKQSMDNAKSAYEYAKKAAEDPAAAKTMAADLEKEIAAAKDLKLDTKAPDAFNKANSDLEAVKGNLTNKEYSKGKEAAGTAIAALKEEIKKMVSQSIEQAKTDVAAAKDAGASEFANDMLAVAEESLANATAASDKADFAGAVAAAEKASSTSKEASEKAKVGKDAAAMAASATTPATETAPAAAPAEGSTEAATTPAVTTDSSAAATTETPAVEKPKEEEPKAEAKAEEPKKEEPKAEAKAEEPKKEETAAKTEETNNKTSGKKGLPIIPIAAGGVVVLAAIAIIAVRMVRKKVTDPTAA